MKLNFEVREPYVDYFFDFSKFCLELLTFVCNFMKSLEQKSPMSIFVTYGFFALSLIGDLIKTMKIDLRPSYFQATI